MCVPSSRHGAQANVPSDTRTPVEFTRALAAHARRLWQAMPDARVNSTGVRVSDGTFACAPCRLLGTHTGPIGRITPTGRALNVHAVVYAELEDGLLLRVRAFFDVYSAAMELGVLPKPRSISIARSPAVPGLGSTPSSIAAL